LTAYLAAQTLLFVLFSMPFMAAHRRLLAGPGYRRWLEGVGATNGQWLLAFPIAACVYAVPAGILFSKADKPMGALLPAAIGVVLCLVAKNLAYALIPRKPLIEAWDGAAFVLMIGFIGSWLLAGGATGLSVWLLWFGVNEVLASTVIAMSVRVFRISPPAPSTRHSATKPKTPAKRRR
jgi:hypothetical protein